MKFTTTDAASTSSGVKVLVYGGSGVGKTVLCATAPNPLIISAESGLLSLRRISIPVIEISNIKDLEESYAWVLKSDDAKQFSTICIDSLSEIAEVFLGDAKKTVKDPRQAYGEMIERMTKVVRSFRDLQGKHVVMTAKMEPLKDEMTGIVRWAPSMPGSKLGNQLPYYFDEVFRLGIGKSAESTFRFLQTQPDLQYDAKDRSGVLTPIELPNLEYVFNKITKG